MLDPLSPDLEWLGAWIAGRALSRGLPTPFLDRGGWRAEVGSESEKRRWLFDSLNADVLALAGEIVEPGLNIRVFCESEALQAELPPGWKIGAPSYAMVAAAPAIEPAIPAGFRLDTQYDRLSAHVSILTDTGEIAASGHAGIGPHAFVYDRIKTMPEYGRRGLGTAVMHALAKAVPDPAMPQLLMATEAGRMLYEKLGWKVVSPYASAGWVG
jgi:GNAT superfamily N-acetyltransferase